MIDHKRRRFIKGSLAAVGAGLIVPSALADWNADAFHAKEVSTAMTGLFGSDAAEVSDRIRIKAPDIAENGASVRVMVETDLDGVTSINLIASKNQHPLVASFEFVDPSLIPFIETNIKMAETADVIALVKAGDKLYKNAKTVTVTLGGCGS